jgi:hypothetical protein
MSPHHAQPGDLIIVPIRRMTWSTAILIAAITVLAVAVAHLSQFGPGIENPTAVVNIGAYVCANNQGVRRITLRAMPGTYTIHCRDGSLHPDVRIDIREP